VDGRVGGAYDFDGSTDYILIEDSASLSFANSDNFTFSVWGKPTTCQASDSKFVEKKDPSDELISVQCSVSTGNPFAHVRDDGSGEAVPGESYNIQDGNWHYLSAVRTGNTVDFFRNGVQKTPDSDTFSGAWNDGDIRIGTSVDYGARFVDGLIDEVRISKINRSDDWIAFEYCNMKDTCNTFGAEEEQSIPVGVKFR
jgi:hypothetical protein